jgi:hypothetical protein
MIACLPNAANVREVVALRRVSECYKFLVFLISCLAIGLSTSCIAEVIAVPAVHAKGTPDVTYTLLYPAKNPKVTLIFIPGGPGSAGLGPSHTDLKNHSTFMLRELALSAELRSEMNVVIFDNPTKMDMGYRGVQPRYGDDHLDRIQDVVQFYKSKTGLPLWLMGHSNGTISATEFINRSERNAQSVVGLILSGSRSEITLDKKINLRLLMLHHEKDQCSGTPYRNAQINFVKFKDLNSGASEFKTVSAGEAAGNPCSDGYHMYRGAYGEAAREIEAFVLR